MLFPGTAPVLAEPGPTQLKLVSLLICLLGRTFCDLGTDNQFVVSYVGQSVGRLSENFLKL